MTNLVSRLRQSDLPAIPTSFSAWLTIGDVEYAVVKVAVRYSRMETKLVVDLAVGFNSRDVGGRRAIPPNFQFIRGTPAQVFLKVDQDVQQGFHDKDGGEPLLRAGTHLLMDGVIDDGGPADLASGRFNMRCIIISKLVYLATGATHFTNVTANQIDTTAPYGVTARAFEGRVNPDQAKADFWAEFKRAVTAILQLRTFVDNTERISTLQEFLRSVGLGARAEAGTNAAAVAALNSIPGAIGGDGGIFGSTDMGRVVANYLSTELVRDLGRQTILQRAQALAEDFFFALIEHGSGYGVVPYTAFVHSSQCKTIWPASTESVGWATHNTTLVSGVVLIAHPHGRVTEPSASGPEGSHLVVGGYRRGSVSSAVNSIDSLGDSLGLFTTLPAPTWMHSRLDNDSGLTVNVREAVDEIRRTYGNVYAREIALRQGFQGRMVLVRGPLRMDVGPCTPVRVVYPAIAGTGVDAETSIFGSVEAVTLVIDAAGKSAMTEMEVMYVRSQAQQELDVDFRPAPGAFQGSGLSTVGFHPLWPQPYLGRRLDEAPVAG